MCPDEGDRNAALLKAMPVLHTGIELKTPVPYSAPTVSQDARVRRLEVRLAIYFQVEYISSLIRKCADFFSETVSSNFLRIFSNPDGRPALSAFINRAEQIYKSQLSTSASASASSGLPYNTVSEEYSQRILQAEFWKLYGGLASRLESFPFLKDSLYFTSTNQLIWTDFEKKTTVEKYLKELENHRLFLRELIWCLLNELSEYRDAIECKRADNPAQDIGGGFSSDKVKNRSFLGRTALEGILPQVLITSIAIRPECHRWFFDSIPSEVFAAEDDSKSMDTVEILYERIFSRSNKISFAEAVSVVLNNELVKQTAAAGWLKLMVSAYAQEPCGSSLKEIVPDGGPAAVSNAISLFLEDYISIKHLLVEVKTLKNLIEGKGILQIKGFNLDLKNILPDKADAIKKDMITLSNELKAVEQMLDERSKIMVACSKLETIQQKILASVAEFQAASIKRKLIAQSLEFICRTWAERGFTGIPALLSGYLASWKAKSKDASPDYPMLLGFIELLCSHLNTATWNCFRLGVFEWPPLHQETEALLSKAMDLSCTSEVSAMVDKHIERVKDLKAMQEKQELEDKVIMGACPMCGAAVPVTAQICSSCNFQSVSGFSKITRPEFETKEFKENAEMQRLTSQYYMFLMDAFEGWGGVLKPYRSLSTRHYTTLNKMIYSMWYYFTICTAVSGLQHAVQTAVPSLSSERITVARTPPIEKNALSAIITSANTLLEKAVKRHSSNQVSKMIRGIRCLRAVLKVEEILSCNSLSLRLLRDIYSQHAESLFKVFQSELKYAELAVDAVQNEEVNTKEVRERILNAVDNDYVFTHTGTAFLLLLQALSAETAVPEVKDALLNLIGKLSEPASEDFCIKEKWYDQFPVSEVCFTKFIPNVRNIMAEILVYERNKAYFETRW
ncbi:MAG: hypothetical protein QW728_02000, partial [Thermoplasmata archaeon]